MQHPSREEYLEKTGGSRPMPVFRDLLADIETPLGAYWKLAHDETFSFLLESVTGGERLARYSIIGTRPKAVVRSKGATARRWTRAGEKRIDLAGHKDPLSLIEEELQGPKPIETEGMPNFVGGAVGFLGYDFARFIESLPDRAEDDLQVDDMAMMITQSIVVFDHARNLIRIIVMANGSPSDYDDASAEIERIATRLKRPIPDLPRGKSENGVFESNRTQEDYEDAVVKAKDYIGAGDGLQFVLSQRFAKRTEAHPLTIYRALRSLNPSPYMFLLRFGDLDVIGASPELLVTSHGGKAHVRPIAGTRGRGKDAAEDEHLALELLNDQKELAEHVMLIDLGRNDLGRVCEFGSVDVEELMRIEKYSHVMHIVSDVAGALRPDCSPYDLIRATFPAGTVSGAPKVRAMEIIDELEPTRRGIYAGAVGCIGSNGDLDLAIAIRTILLKNGIAYVQAGAGIVWDSKPTTEHMECYNKAKASLTAIDVANSGNLASL